ncbi:FtsX-like permease family protein [Paucibacter sp. B2R-40]|uniref:FtsX-like permease family protein n=1 Tax=Paucibacter sp. B2R-40 TaxID=2893554 RepID=UPI0021E4E93A|nr:FtsX-like permease family protein [Paucibacter sp. B2R-40]MCV2355852.1 FtsX-like permease family protein [Paucibacter sp. B2R-40]
MSWSWLAQLSWPALRHQAGRQILALLSIMLGVALAFAVHLLNSSALSEFSKAAASLNGQADLVLRGAQGALAEGVYGEVAALPGLAQAAPVLEGQAQAVGADGKRFNLRVIGLDFLQSGPINPELMPADLRSITNLLDPATVFLNPAAMARLDAKMDGKSKRLSLRAAQGTGQARSFDFAIGPPIAATGSPLVVLDIAGAQMLLGRLGELDRIDLRLETGQSAQAWLANNALPQGLSASPPPDEGSRLSAMTRAYRVNLGVLSLMALFTGSFLVFAVMSLSVAQRLPQLALLGVLGMSAKERAALILSEGLALGLLGSAAGLLLGYALASVGQQVLGADLGFAVGKSAGKGFGLALSAAQLSAAAIFSALGVLISLLASALPAWSVRRMPVALVLRGLGNELEPEAPRWLAPALLLIGLALAFVPPLPAWPDVPLAAYAAMFFLLLGGIACVPDLLRLALGLLACLPRAMRGSAIISLVRERARDQAGEASRALAGVLVALSLSVAMLVMVGSFRDSLNHWLAQMLPADLYVRSSLRLQAWQGAPLPPGFADAVRASGLADKVTGQRSSSVWIDGQAEAIDLMARELEENQLPLAEPLAEPLAGPLAEPIASSQQALPVYINEHLRDQLQLRPGQALSLRLKPGGAPLAVYVRGIWRDYARQSGALMLPLSDYRRWSGDTQLTELYIWLKPGATSAQATQTLKALQSGSTDDLEFAAVGELKQMSLTIFDRSFAVTHWLQAVALGIGLFGIAASQSAQVLARRREFGLLLHLGLSRADVLRLLALEAALLSGVGALAGLGLGLALSAVLVWVVNPQSFHWSMDMSLPWPRLFSLLGAVFAAGLAASLLAAWRATGADVVQAVKEDW